MPNFKIFYHTILWVAIDTLARGRTLRGRWWCVIIIRKCRNTMGAYTASQFHNYNFTVLTCKIEEGNKCDTQKPEFLLSHCKCSHNITHFCEKEKHTQILDHWIIFIKKKSLWSQVELYATMKQHSFTISGWIMWFKLYCKTVLNNWLNTSLLNHKNK